MTLMTMTLIMTKSTMMVRMMRMMTTMMTMMTMTMMMMTTSADCDWWGCSASCSSDLRHPKPVQTFVICRNMILGIGNFSPKPGFSVGTYTSNAFFHFSSWLLGPRLRLFHITKIIGSKTKYWPYVAAAKDLLLCPPPYLLRLPLSLPWNKN